MISFWNEARPKMRSSKTLAVVDFAVVDVQEQAAVVGEDAVGVFETGGEEREVVVVGVVEGSGALSSSVR